MRKFVLLIFSILVLFLFVMPGMLPAEIVSSPDRTIENGTNIATIPTNIPIGLTGLSVMATNCLNLKQHPECQTKLIKNTLDESHLTNSTNIPGVGIILKCPILKNL